ncbi:MAG TPA: helix-turn-helix transcriptional regulator [Acidobacteriaceae bacterium]|nr:helix-turn-helix transcriptional regulator [Acidobacteriaceae bacterium]
MGQRESLGEFEQLILLAIVRLAEDAYGVTIRHQIQLATQRVVSPGSLYTTLERLEDKGLLSSRTGETTPVRGGRAKRFYQLTSLGRRRLVSSQQAFQKLLAGTGLLEKSHGQNWHR